MTSQTTLALFNEKFKIKSLVTVPEIMKKMSVSRPTATNLISTLLNRRLTYKHTFKKHGKHTSYLEPFAKTGDSKKWYILRRY